MAWFGVGEWWVLLFTLLLVSSQMAIAPPRNPLPFHWNLIWVGCTGRKPMANHSRVKFFKSVQRSRILHPISAVISAAAVRDPPFQRRCSLSAGLGDQMCCTRQSWRRWSCESASWDCTPGVRRLLPASMGALLRWLHTSAFPLALGSQDRNWEETEESSPGSSHLSVSYSKKNLVIFRWGRGASPKPSSFCL